jgi:lipoprotein-anchoring transpeptidase ErfK/SrfK
MPERQISRKEFLHIAALGLGGLGFAFHRRNSQLIEFPAFDRLGRICVGMVEVKARPSLNSQTIGVLYEDAVLPWLNERAAVETDMNRIIQRWVETPDGFIYAPYIQPVRNLPNLPVTQLFALSMGDGMWAEVTVPYAEVILNNAPSSNSWVRARVEQGLPVRVYYGQVFFVDRIETKDDGKLYYRVNPNYYGGLDMLWVPAEAMRQIAPEELDSINPEAMDKRVVVDIKRQTLSCFEGAEEVFYCRVSTGIEAGSTPLGLHRVSRKFISLQMSGSGSGGTGAGYDLPGIGWTSIFVTGGVAIHATVWHNEFGFQRSHGCVNCLPEDAKWIFRWVQPAVGYDPGMVDVSLTGEASTMVEVIES